MGTVNWNQTFSFRESISESLEELENSQTDRNIATELDRVCLILTLTSLVFSR